MTHTDEPMTLAQISDAMGEKLRAAGSYAKWTNLHHAIIEWREGIDAELAKQRQVEPGELPEALEINAVARLYYTGVGSRRYKRASTMNGPGEPLCFLSLAREKIKRAYWLGRRDLCTHPQQRNAVDGNKPEKRWPFVESPGDFTERLAIAMQNFPLLGAVRHVLVEDPPNLSSVASRDREDAERYQADEVNIEKAAKLIADTFGVPITLSVKELAKAILETCNG